LERYIFVSSLQKERVMQTESVIVEIRAAEGGADAKSLVEEQLAIYVSSEAEVALASRSSRRARASSCFAPPVVGVRALFEGEAGGHRWQRVPPNEKRGRVQSSTITVAVLDDEYEAALVIRDEDLEWSTCRAPGNGGQHVQKTDSAVQLTHVPSGIQSAVTRARSQHQNKADALAKLRARPDRRRTAAVAASRAAARQLQVWQRHARRPSDARSARSDRLG